LQEAYVLISMLFEETLRTDAYTITKIAEAGSSRIYCRLHSGGSTYIGVHGNNVCENQAFLSITRHFVSQGIRVPRVIAVADDMSTYILSDLGDESLLDFIHKNAGNREAVVYMYKQVLLDLVNIQVDAGRDFDFEQCLSRKVFDSRQVYWDLLYFKYYFLKIIDIPFDEQQLDDEFLRFSTYIGETEEPYFMYRDFQSRNIMIKDGLPHYIDYQGGMRGPLQYDVASLLFQSRVDMDESTRGELLDFYIQHIQSKVPVGRDEFVKKYYAIVLARTLQTLGAYGFRGLIQKRSVFVQSIPLAIKVLRQILPTIKKQHDFNYLFAILEKIIDINTVELLMPPSLKISVNSFSYKRGLPVDTTGNGGGFVFDCRAIENPGKIEEYKRLTGRDQAVVDYLESQPETDDFFKHIIAMVMGSVNRYKERGFTDLMVSFGCTGGRHRSVYFAERTAKYLSEQAGVVVDLKHCEKESW